jgi:glycosyltransferase involved in cell wall biosynthesis
MPKRAMQVPALCFRARSAIPPPVMTKLSLPRSIAIVLPDLGGGGAQRVMLTLADGFLRMGVAVTIVVVGGKDVLEPPPGVVVERLGAARLRSALPRLIRVLRRLDAEVIISVMGYLNMALAAARPLLGRSRLVLREANRLSVTRDALPGPLAGLGYRLAYPRADLIVAPTQRIAAEIAAAAPGARGRIVEVPNPVDVAGLRSRAARPERAAGPGLRIVGAGRLTKAKGFERLIAAARGLPPDSQITIYGTGPEQSALQSQIDDAGLSERVRLAGFSRDLPQAIAGADVFALPSRVEGLPNVGLEALALGTKVIAWDSAEMDGVECAIGAVRLVRDVEGFTAALLAIAPDPVQAPRPALLGDIYHANSVVTRWAELLGRAE